MMILDKICCYDYPVPHSKNDTNQTIVISEDDSSNFIHYDMQFNA